jgi:hypothetical protein
MKLELAVSHSDALRASRENEELLLLGMVGWDPTVRWRFDEEEMIAIPWEEIPTVIPWGKAPIDSLRKVSMTGKGIETGGHWHLFNAPPWVRDVVLYNEVGKSEYYCTTPLKTGVHPGVPSVQLDKIPAGGLTPPKRACRPITPRTEEQTRDGLYVDLVKEACEAYRKYVEECPEGEWGENTQSNLEHAIMEAAVDRYLGEGFWDKVNERMG